MLLEKYGMNDLAEKIIFIAGHKVTNDPVCIPFSMGRNLICIHSKKHIKNPPEDMPRKQAQNLESMKVHHLHLRNTLCEQCDCRPWVRYLRKGATCSGWRPVGDGTGRTRPASSQSHHSMPRHWTCSVF